MIGQQIARGQMENRSYQNGVVYVQEQNRL